MESALCWNYGVKSVSYHLPHRIHLLVGIGNFVDAALSVILLLCFVSFADSETQPVLYDLLSNIAVRHLTHY